jgi:hypothetical protein
LVIKWGSTMYAVDDNASIALAAATIAAIA